MPRRRPGPTAKSQPVATEAAEQAALVQWLRFRGVRFFAVPNGAILGGRNRFGQMSRLRTTGMLAGAPDLVLIDLAPATGQPVAIEMKRTTGGRLSDAQAAVHTAMRDAGWSVVVARGFADAVRQLAALGIS